MARRQTEGRNFRPAHKMSAADAERGEAGEFLAAPTADGGGVGGDTSHPDALPAPTTSGSGGGVDGILRQSGHPNAAIAHVAFKLGAVLSYLLVGFFTSSFVIQFVLSVTLLAFDFWTVKNVSGRLLVGLRWWHAAPGDGSEGADAGGWRFETIPDRAAVNKTDSRIFWGALYATPAVWVLLGVVCVLKFNMSYLVIVAIAMVLSGANIVGYYKCNKEATEQMRDYLGKTALGAAMERSGLGGLARFVS